MVHFLFHSEQNKVAAFLLIFWEIIFFYFMILAKQHDICFCFFREGGEKSHKGEW